MQCSHLLYEISRERAVWSSAYDIHCDKMPLDKEAFGQATSLDSDALEKLVTTYTRFRLRSHRFTSAPDHANQPLPSNVAWSVRCAPTGPIRTLRLLPGGRFLILIVSSTIQLWDLGLPGQEEARCLRSENLNIDVKESETSFLVPRAWFHNGQFMFTVRMYTPDLR